MSDSSWQQAVLREIGVSGRRRQRLDAAPHRPAEASWGAEAPPRPAPERQPSAARTAVIRVVHEVFSRSLAAGVTR
ncbi:hypothetical protein [Actinomadura sp. BRA 177]|uniref:hypothetical protein n=1 Tax=Actinomadura sp. BRA 177 TaxID=2745202 RepID=UPI001594F216|nr:hypothetical protein [Actinomadura sp. BRA 177]NVI91996.1 hypothetical protein [Actinomadura sp. BRA 177]